MGLTITSLRTRSRLAQIAESDARLAEHRRARARGELLGQPNSAAWFLDRLVARMAPTLPENIFTQGVGGSGPGDLDPPACRAPAAALQAADSVDVLASYAPIDGSDPRAGLDVARLVARIVSRAADEDGLTVY